MLWFAPEPRYTLTHLTKGLELQMNSSIQFQCLIQNENAHKMSEMGIADAGGPACDVFGNYMMVQCGMLGCYCESKDGKLPFHPLILSLATSFDYRSIIDHTF